MPEEDLNTSEFLRELADKLRQVPVAYNLDDYHIDRLHDLATLIEAAGDHTYGPPSTPKAGPVHPTTLELSEQFPELKQIPPTDVERWRKTLCRLAPLIMSDATILGCALIDLCVMKRIEPQFVKTILEAEQIFLTNMGYE